MVSFFKHGIFSNSVFFFKLDGLEKDNRLKLYDFHIKVAFFQYTEPVKFKNYWVSALLKFIQHIVVGQLFRRLSPCVMSVRLIQPVA